AVVGVPVFGGMRIDADQHGVLVVRAGREPGLGAGIPFAADELAVYHALGGTADRHVQAVVGLGEGQVDQRAVADAFPQAGQG
nr:hypothetical protein [Tanacetum cinerariifolium]